MIISQFVFLMLATAVVLIVVIIVSNKLIYNIKVKVQKSDDKKPNKQPNPYIGDTWELINDIEWVTPRYNNINRILVLNVSRAKDKILCRELIKDGVERNSINGEEFEMTIVFLHCTHKRISSPNRPSYGNKSKVNGGPL